MALDLGHRAFLGRTYHLDFILRHCGVNCGHEMNEREEMDREREVLKRGQEEALSEAFRLLPQARGWLAVAVMADGNPIVLMNLPQYADTVCVKEVAVMAANIHLSRSFDAGPTQAA